MFAPAARMVKTPLSNCSSPAMPTLPMSCAVHGDGTGPAVDVPAVSYFSWTAVAESPVHVAPPGRYTIVPIVAPPMPWRGVGMFGSDVHVFVDGLKSSDSAIVPQLSALPSPPNTWMCPLTVPIACPPCACCIGGPLVHVLVAGSKISTMFIGVQVLPMTRPPIA